MSNQPMKRLNRLRRKGPNQTADEWANQSLDQNLRAIEDSFSTLTVNYQDIRLKHYLSETKSFSTGSTGGLFIPTGLELTFVNQKPRLLIKIVNDQTKGTVGTISSIGGTGGNASFRWRIDKDELQTMTYSPGFNKANPVYEVTAYLILKPGEHNLSFDCATFVNADFNNKRIMVLELPELGG